jgi:hypothetical protein
MRLLRSLAALAALALVAGCASAPVPPAPATPAPAGGGVLRSFPMDRALEDRILALNPEKVSAADVRDTLSRAPAPRVFLIRGGIYPVYLAMESMGAFLIGMGYPGEKVITPHERDWSLSPYESSPMIAGMLAWCYEREGVRPTMIGHSQGGIQAIKVLHELAGAWLPELHPFNPQTMETELRTTIVDPLTGRERPVLGLRLGFVGVVGTGGWALALPNHWGVLDRVRTIPDTVDEFVGFRIGFDLWALDGPAFDEVKTFRANGSAVVRNTWLPEDYYHVWVPRTGGLAKDPAMRAWIDAYVPGNREALAPLPDPSAENVIFGAEAWYYLKKHWAIEAQRFVRARRGQALD